MADKPAPPGAARPRERAYSLAPGSTIGNYQIEGVAGVGGMGVVYRATQMRPRRTVALKVIRTQLAADPEFRERFEREAEIAASIQNPRVIPIFEAGEQGGVLYLAMAYIDGVDLRRWLVDNGPMPAARAVGVITQVAEALDAAHETGLVHRDVKPGNILLRERGRADHIYLTDFGLTKRQESTVGPTKVGTWVGTVDYSPPEQIRGERVDARSDVYALACVLFELLSGEVPFERDTDVSKMFAHVQDPPPLLGGLAPELARFDRVTQRALAKDPRDRFPSAGDFARAVAAAAESRAVTQSEKSVARGAAAPLRQAAAPPPLQQAAAPPPLREQAAPPPERQDAAPPLRQAAAPPQRQDAAPPPPREDAAVPSPRGDSAETRRRPRPPRQASAAPPLRPPSRDQQSVRQAETIRDPGRRPRAHKAPSAPPSRPWWRRRALLGMLVAGAATVLVVVLVLGLSGTSDAQAVQNTVTGYYDSSGPAVCNFLSPANVANHFGTVARCEQANQGTESAPLTGTQNVQINGIDATDSGFSQAGHPMMLALVKENGKWLIDRFDNLDVDAVVATMMSWSHTPGPSNCNFFSMQYLDAFYNSSRKLCRSRRARFVPATIVGNQSVSLPSATQATDSLKLSNGNRFVFDLSKQPSGKWLIDNNQRQ